MSSRRDICLHSGKIGARSKIAQNSEVRMSRFLDTSSTTQMTQIMVKHCRSSGTSWTKFVRAPTCGTFLGKTVRGSSAGAWLGKVPNWECLFVHREQGLFLSAYMDHIKVAGKKQEMAPTWKKWMKDVDLEEPTSFLDRVNLGCTQRECKPKES